MRKSIRRAAGVLGLAAILTAPAPAAVLMYWGTDSGIDGTEVVDLYRPLDLAISTSFDGTVLREADNYYIGLFHYLPTSVQLNDLWVTDFTTGGGAALYAATAANASAGGNPDSGQIYQEIADITAWNGNTLYSVMITAAPADLVGTTTPYAYYTFTSTKTLDWTIPPPRVDYVVEDVANNAWSVIPEPGAAMLALAGCAGLLLRRRLRGV